MIELLITGFLQLRLLDIIDILLVAILLYELYRVLRGTTAINIFIGIMAIFLVWHLVKLLEMELLSEILGAFTSVGFIALIVVFQPEIRKFLLLLGTTNFIRRKQSRFLFWRINMENLGELDIDPIVQACRRMSISKTGALLIVAKKSQLREYTATGEILNARISGQLLESIFFKNSPLHDGAAIIVDNRIKAARCILPVSKNTNIPINLGLRHRAAVGITERSDAIAVIVSEETGKLSYSKGGVLTTRVEPSQLKNFLEREFNRNKNE
ncbi:MAG: diadenylate cyclase CdaA [Bacteroidales bacterium]|nr:diadenylate cyclase CdaA [Bacteroidales bacterium]